MTDWTAGYVADIGYTHGYYAELNPLRVQLAFLSAGLVCPEFGNACELGFGQGVSANLHAAASVTQWCGTDFNPAQAAFAQELAAASGSGARWLDEDFAEFTQRDDLPEFDYIGLHGIWSWISDANRAVIVDFVRRKLKVGGVLYISYNTQPGWAAFAPMRHLLTQHADAMGVQGQGIVNRVEGALAFAEKLLATEPGYAKFMPQVIKRLEAMKGQNRQYLAHEYFNRDWHPMYFADMARWLEPAKLQFACSAHYLDHVDAIQLTPAQQALQADVPDPMLRETVRDYMVNQQFRRDYWVKGARQLNALERAEALRQQKVLLIRHRPDVSLKVQGALGEASMSAAIYEPLLDLLADHQPRTLAQLEQALAAHGGSFAQMVQAVIVLAGAGHLAAVQDAAQTAKVHKASQRINAHLQNKARGSQEVGYLASPVTGGGVTVPRFEQLFLLARSQGHKQPGDWAQFVWQWLQAQNQRMVLEGRTLETAEEHLAALQQQAVEFAAKRLPVLKALQIA